MRRNAMADKATGIGVALVVTILTFLAFLAAQGLIPYYGFAKGALLVALIFGLIIGVHARTRLKENVEDEFTSGHAALRRKIFLLLYEGLFLIALVLCLSALTAMVTHEVILWTSG